MNKTLLPCPFCGGEAIVVKTESCGRYVGCWDCGGRTEEFETDYAGSAHDKAIAAWNRRTGKDINVATNNAVPVVRCSECKRFERHTEVDTECGGCYPPGKALSVRTVHENDYCSYGAKMEVEHERN